MGSNVSDTVSMGSNKEPEFIARCNYCKLPAGSTANPVLLWRNMPRGVFYCNFNCLDKYLGSKNRH